MNFRSSNRVTEVASKRAVHSAFAWLHGNPKTIMDWQAELTAIPAPPFGEAARGRWLAEQFQAIGLQDVRIDALGNVFGSWPAAGLPAASTGPVVVLSAHLDTVFPAETPLQPKVDGERLEAPGACDNGAGLAGLLAIAKAISAADMELPAPLIFLGNVGEEGEGNLRGVRHFYQQDPLASRVSAHLILDGAGEEAVVTRALGSRRFRVSISGPGGHSFSDAGTPNPIAALSTALASVAQTQLPTEPRTTMNFGTIQGGASVNAIPEKVVAAIDFRSTSSEELTRLEKILRHAVEEAVLKSNLAAKNNFPRHRGPLGFQIEEIGDRPAAQLSADSPLYRSLLLVDRHLGLRTEPMLGSTDANIPLSLGVPALSMGAGGDGGGAHTLGEWYSAQNRDLGLKRVLLLTLTMLEEAAER